MRPNVLTNETLPMTITRDDVLAAAQRVGERPTQAAVARELGITRHQLVRLITPEELRSAVGAPVPPADVSAEQMLQAAETLAERSGFDGVTLAALGAYFGRSEKWAEKRVRMSAVWARLKARGFTGSRMSGDDRRAQIYEAARSLGFTGLTYARLAKACNCSDVLVRTYYPDLATLGEPAVPAEERRAQIINAVKALASRDEPITSGRVGREIGAAASTVRFHFDRAELVALAK